MKWGVRQSKRQITNALTGRQSMKLQFFAKKTDTRKSVKMKPTEYAHVMSEIRNNITKEQKKMPVFMKAIGNYMYTVENHFDDSYRLIGRKKIPQSTTGILERLNDGK